MRRKILFLTYLIASVPGLSVSQTWDFDFGSLQSWEIANDNGIADSTTAESYSGIYGIRLSKTTSTDRIEFALYNPPALATNQLITYKVYIPSDTSNLMGISPYIQFDETNGDGDDWDGYHSEWNAISDLEPGAWNSVSINVPEHITLQSIGLQVLAKSTSEIPDLFIDFITADSAAISYASLNLVEEIRIDSVGTRFVGVSWDKVKGRGLSHYRLERSIHQSETTAVFDSIISNSYVDLTVKSATRYSYRAIPVDTLGRTPQYVFHNASATTDAFEQYSTWDFESDSQNWIDGNSEEPVQVVDSISFSGFHSVMLEVKESEPHNFIINREVSPEAGQYFAFNFFIPESATNIDGFTVSSNISDDTVFVYKPITEFEVGAWNIFEYQIPEYDSTSFVAFSVISSTTGASPIYIDLISSDPNEQGSPTILPPSNLQLTSISYNDASLMWAKSEGYGDVFYRVQFYQAHPRPDTPGKVNETSDLSFSFSDLIPGVNYKFYVWGVDHQGRHTDSVFVESTTPDFETHATFDFESGFEAWTTSQANAEIVDTRSYSGVYSVAFTTEGKESFFEYIDTNTEAPGTPNIRENIVPGHTITYRVWVDQADTSKIELFQVWAKDGSWSWSSKVVTIDEIIPDSWNELSYKIPDSIDNLNSAGLQVIGRGEGNPEVTIYIDLISTLAEPILRPHLTIPSSVTAVANTNSEYTVTWNPSTGNDTVLEYRVYRGNDSVLNLSDFDLITTTTNTTFTERRLAEGTYRIRVSAVSTDHKETFASTTSEVVLGLINSTEDKGLPKEFALHNNYPNPFNPSTKISYSIPQQGFVSLEIFDIAGRKVSTLVNKVQIAGEHAVDFDASSLSSGVYLYRLKSGIFVQTNRMILLK